MSEHLSTEIVDRFQLQQMGSDDQQVIYDHVLACDACRQRIVDSRGEAFALQTLSEHLLPKNGEEPYHLDYEMIERFVDDELDTVDRSTAEMHFKACAACLAEVTDLRESLATMRAASIRQDEKKTTLRKRLLGLTRWPAFSAPLRVSAVVAFAALAIIAAVVIWRQKSGSNQAPAGGSDLTAGSKATPIQSPAPGISNPPSPNPGPSPNKSAPGAPNKRPTKPPEELLALNDGPSKITFDRPGKLVGLEAVSRDTQQAVKEVLTAETIKKPDVLAEFAGAEVSLRAPTGNEETVKLVYPANTVIAEDRPLFEWLPSKTAHAYRVEVGDAGFHQVAKSEDLPATTRSWTPSTPLKRGVVYTWVLRVMNKGAEGPVSSSSQGKFKVLEDEKVKELNRLETTSQSHLALGIFYARAGMIAEAERELQILVKENPRSTIAKKLLKQIQSW